MRYHGNWQVCSWCFRVQTTVSGSLWLVLLYPLLLVNQHSYLITGWGNHPPACPSNFCTKLNQVILWHRHPSVWWLSEEGHCTDSSHETPWPKWFHLPEKCSEESPEEDALCLNMCSSTCSQSISWLRPLLSVSDYRTIVCVSTS